uniref:Bm11899 n=1 Tax=Brugia malayi TaxID=6279 RepID=A0A1I9GDS3_BRUMA|nr:Bm11899 [Brugia malayi]
MPSLPELDAEAGNCDFKDQPGLHSETLSQKIKTKRYEDLQIPMAIAKRLQNKGDTEFKWSKKGTFSPLGGGTRKLKNPKLCAGYTAVCGAQSEATPQPPDE